MNKPVAWWDGNPKNAIGISKTKDCDDWFPLYTHPVKELTDEEIEECYWGDGYPNNPRHPKEFARAILRKAQEK